MPTSFADVRAAFESRSVLRASRSELEEMLAAAACEKPADKAARAQLHEMGHALRRLIANRRGAELRRPSGVAVFALLLMAAALVWSGVQLHQSQQRADVAFTPAASSTVTTTATADESGFLLEDDERTSVTIRELARRAPSLRTGTLQAWWSGEQARQVQRLEAQAKRQTLAGDFAGAAQARQRADSIRNEIPALANFEKAPTR